MLKWEFLLDENILKGNVCVKCMGKFWSYIIPAPYTRKLHEWGHLKQVSLYMSLDESFVLTVGDHWS